MEIKDDTEALRQYLSTTDPEADIVESVHRAEVDAATAMTIMANPKAAIKAMGVPTTDESAVQVTMKNRADRAAVTSLATEAARAARLRRIIIIVIHYRNCDADIIIFAS
ncbi:hypothetical protein E4L96_02860 [Massilia arenosa]|uniref:Uncharacterized protein n=1 Tax=Zemynaea arenosa TaxID=2561931 RepID=A0A4Y9SNE3_9BURK|nr:hypothetical protein [Massilia arenosa]TFW28200.1 hypothetical protein E4L96_02860 [Massilia arenosa]